jgi:hypothetical protein
VLRLETAVTGTLVRNFEIIARHDQLRSMALNRLI